MQFQHPYFLWGLLALIIPILIHLFELRKFERVSFSNLEFLKELKEEHQSQSKVKELLVLLARLCFIAFLVLAFAQPFIPSEQSLSSDNSEATVAIFIDNSHSMSAQIGDIPSIEIAKNKAKAIINTLPEQTQYIVLDHQLTPKQFLPKYAKDALGRIDEITIQNSVSTINDIYNRVLAKSIKEVFVVSDFQTNHFSQSIQDTSIHFHWAPVNSSIAQNISIDSVWINTPTVLQNAPIKVFVKVTNHADIDINTPIQYSLNNSPRPSGAVKIAPSTSAIDTLQLTLDKKGWNSLTVNITDAPIQFDDTYHANIYVDENINILSIYEKQKDKTISSFFKNNATIKLTQEEVSKTKYSAFGQYNLIILENITQLSSGIQQELAKYQANGGNLFVFPTNNISSTNQLLRQLNVDRLGPIVNESIQAGKLNTNNTLIKNVYEQRQKNINLPTVNNYHTLSLQSKIPASNILTLRNGKPLLRLYKGQGKVLLSTVNISTEASDLMKNTGIILPLIYNMALTDASQTPLAYTVGKDQSIKLLNKTGIKKDQTVTLQQGKLEVIPAQNIQPSVINLFPKGNINEAGFYNINHDTKTIGAVAFNTDRTESVLNFIPTEALTNIASKSEVLSGENDADFMETLSTKYTGKSHWKWCIGLSLLFLFLEIIFIRYWKTN